MTIHFVLEAGVGQPPLIVKWKQVHYFGSRFEDSGLGLGFVVWGLGFRMEGLGSRVGILGFRVGKAES